MSGHSKWHNIQRRKGKQDAVRGQLFTKLSRDVYLAAKEGGGNPETNFRLKVAIDRAKQNNLPAETISRTIAKATGSLPGVTYEEITYEGYGPYGVAVMLDIVTDNRNRTAADVRHIFKKRGGNLGESGSVSWMFRRVGSITIDKEALNSDYDELLMVALEAGADDLKEFDDEYQILTSPEQFKAVRDALEGDGYVLADAELSYQPDTVITLDGHKTEELLELIEALETLDDVQNVYTNLDDIDSGIE